MWRCALLTLACGCRAVLGFEDVELADASGCTTYSTFLQTCSLREVGARLEITSKSSYDTDARALVNKETSTSQTMGVSMELLAGETVTVIAVDEFVIATDAVLAVNGPHPLVIVAQHDVIIHGTLDLSAGGAGTRSVQACGAGAGGNGSALFADTVSGGGGGGLGTAGGEGGRGTAGSRGGDAGAALVDPAIRLLGGCPGGDGGSRDDEGSVHASGGRGGGAVMLIARGSIVVDGAINAGGGGGRGGQVVGGGGGGGSGGTIVLEATSLDATGTIAANGGGGGGGAGSIGPIGSSSGLPGGPGGGTMPALGGMGATNGGPGGNGAAGTIASGAGGAATPDGLNQGGGGGGGGGLGRIVTRVMSSR